MCTMLCRFGLGKRNKMPESTIKATTMSDGGTTLLIIDGQNDFHPGDERNTLPVANADKDMDRVVALIRRSIQSFSTGGSDLTINRIVATLDSHHKLHIAHPKFWVNDEGKNPDPFTIISSEDIKEGKWSPRKDLKLPINRTTLDLNIMKGGSLKDKIYFDSDGNLDLQSYCVQYAAALESSGRFKICVWPEHCIIGTRGHCLVDPFNEAISEWSDATGSSAEFVQKGENLLTEMYSALSAEVPISAETSFNQELFDSLNKSSKILVVGQALSHCVNNTVRDLLEHMTEEDRKKVYLLSDCASPVVGFEDDGAKFVQYVKDSGANVCKADEI
mmetsp:Transcript_6087/g.9167  ORF Transcript_6087/g.9167 Transcript_6087/m.9167 type:complete len:332 (-) Transcript_6087:685-1680(-)